MKLTVSDCSVHGCNISATVLHCYIATRCDDLFHLIILRLYEEIGVFFKQQRHKYTTLGELVDLGLIPEIQVRAGSPVLCINVG
jgi:hypothetical protein